MALGTAISIFFVRKETQKLSQLTETPALKLIKQDIEIMRKRVEDGYGRIAFQLGQIQEIGRTMRDFQDFLKSPKLRGGIGEQILRDLLEQILPKQNFKIQHQFREGQIVDAIIKTKQGVIPIDSKFPMESFAKIHKAKEKEKENYLKEFARAIKKHIEEISRKYILPQEGTVDFALMYIPSEPVYYEITLNHPDLLSYGYEKKVYFVSPNTFFYFLKIIMIGLEGARIEEASRKILEGLKAIQGESVKFGQDLSLLVSHVNHAKKTSEKVQSGFERLAGRIDHLGMLETPKQPRELEEPK